MNDSIGFMQGRLSPLVDGKIQAFPWTAWRDEFEIASRLGFEGMEWTIDADRLHENPLVTPEGRRDIARLVDRWGVAIWSVTGDCFMQAPFWKASGTERLRRIDDVRRVAEGCAAAGGRWVVVPLVDNGALQSAEEQEVLVDCLVSMADWLRSEGAGVAFESDFSPARLAALVSAFPADTFGVNLDIGNSASLGWNTDAEIAALHTRIVNVHVKDRVFGGTTVPLGTGAADLPRTLALLREAGYAGRYVLQTARAADGDHGGMLQRYRDMVREWLAAAPALRSS